MTKKLLCFLLVVLILSLAACRSEGSTKLPTEESDKPTTEEPTTGEPSTEKSTSTEPVEPETTYHDQITLLAVNYSQWVKSDSAAPYSFAVTDLDRNGRLEVVASVCMGTGFFSFTDIWEVNETFDGVTLCKSSDEENSQSDIIVPSLTAYVRKDDCHYIVTDVIRSGYAYNREEIRSFLFKDGGYSEELLAYRETEVSEDYEETATYYNANGEVISEAEFEQMPKVRFPADFKPYTVTFGWQSLYEDEIAVMGATAWQDVLSESWDGFSFTAVE